MSNDFYNPSGSPTTGAAGSSAVQRTEFASIAAGFAKLPGLTGSGARAVIVNAGGTALTVTTGTLALAGNFATTGAFNTTFAQSASTTLTLPGASGTLATLAGVEAFTNKTYNGLTISTTTGTLAIAAGVTVTVSNSLTLAGTDGTTMTFPGTSASIARTDAGQSFSGTQAFGTLTATTVNGMTLAGSGTVNFGTGGTVLYTNVAITLSGDVTGTGSTAITTAVAKIAGTAVSGTTGSGNVVFATSPTVTGISSNTFTSTVATGTAPFTVTSTTVVANLNAAQLNGATFASPGTIGGTTPGAATVTTLNKVTVTAPASAATLTIADGKTLTANASLTFAGTDATTLTFQGTDTYVGRATTDILTNKTYDTAGAGNVLKVNGTTVSDKTGTGKVVLDTSPALTTPTLGVASATSLAVTGSSAPANGMYLPAASILGLSANSAAIARILTTTSGAPGLMLGSVLSEGPGAQQFYIATTVNGGFAAGRFSNDTNGNQTGTSYKSRGASIDTHGAVVSGDTIDTTFKLGSDGAAYRIASSILVAVDGAVSSGIVPGRVIFNTANTSGTNTEALRLDSAQQVFMPGATTTASAANAFIDNATTPANQLKRSTSSARYKKDIEDLESQIAADFIEKARPVWYRSAIPSDKAEWSWYGLIAEEVAAIDPRLVHWSPEKRETVYDEIEEDEAVTEKVSTPHQEIQMRDGKAVLVLSSRESEVTVFDEFPLFDEAGRPVMIAAQVSADGTEIAPTQQATHRVARTRKVTRRVPREVVSGLIPDGVQYERLCVMLLSVVKNLRQRLEAVENK